MSDTPETDAVWQGSDTIKQVMTSRRLERERDEALKAASQMSESNQVLQAEVRDFRQAKEAAVPTDNETHLKLVLEEVAKLAKTLKAERDEARGEAVRYRSLYFTKLGIDASASWFPWEAAK